MSGLSLKAVWDEAVGMDFKIDRLWLKKVSHWKRRYQSLNAEHMSFFSGHYFGHSLPVWTRREDHYWLVEICGVDVDVLDERLEWVEGLNRDWAVSSDVRHMALVYLMFRVQQSTLSKQEKLEGEHVCLEVLMMKMLSSLMHRYFSRGTVSIDVAQAVYNRLSRRFDIKEQGSWAKFISHRAREILEGESRVDAVWDKRAVLESFEAGQVVLFLNMVKTRLNKAMRELYAVLQEVLLEKDRVSRTSALKVGSEGVYIADLSRGVSDLLHYQDQIFYDPRSWLKLSLMETIEGSIPAIAVKRFRGTLEYLSEGKLPEKLKGQVESCRHEIVYYGMEIIQEEQIPGHDLVTIASRLRQNFMSGKANDKRLMMARKVIDQVIYHHQPKAKRLNVSLERTAVLMYIVIRTLAMQHYQ